MTEDSKAILTALTVAGGAASVDRISAEVKLGAAWASALDALVADGRVKTCRRGNRGSRKWIYTP